MKLSYFYLVVIILLCTKGFVAGSDNLKNKSDHEISITKRKMTDNELKELKSLLGEYEEGKNYNKTYNGFGTGLIPPTAEDWEKMKDQETMVDKMTFPKTSAPSSHDNSATIWFPPIGNQGSEGSCVAWATGYYNKTFQEAKEHNWDLSSCSWDGGWGGNPNKHYQDKIFSPDFIYHQINNGSNNGSTYQDALNLLEKIGCCTWDHMPYDMNDHTTWPADTAWLQAPAYRSYTGYTSSNCSTDVQINDLKLFLSESMNAVISIDSDYYGVLGANDLWTIDTYTAGTGHANLIVGYDDDHGPYTEDGATRYGAFKVANSWGIGYWENDNDGFYWISYECMKQKVKYYMFSENFDNYTPETIAEFSIDHNHRGDCSVIIGKGEPTSWTNKKQFDDYWIDGGSYPYPNNTMAMDITELGTPTEGDNYFIKIYDGGASSTGQITSFAIKTFDDYTSKLPTAIYTSTETPVNTVQSDYAYAQVEITASVPADLEVTSTTLSSGETNCFNAENEITIAGNGTSVLLENGSSANFIAGQSIQFLPGFQAQAGSYMDAHITNTASFCEETGADPMVAETSCENYYTEKSTAIPFEEINDDIEFQPENMIVYPNPNNGRFNIQLNQLNNITRIVIYNSVGQSIFNQSTSQSDLKVELEGMKKGIYVIKAFYSNHQFDQKIIIQ